MKWIFIPLFFLSSLSAYAQSRDEINSMLERFKASGVFSEEDVKRAQAQLMEMSDTEVKELKEKAGQKAADPKIHKDLQKLK